MIGVDTNILIRVVLDDHLQESSIAKKLLDKLVKKKNLFISSYTILEMIWVLKTKGYSREEIYEAALDLLDSPGVMIGNREIITSALEKYIKGKANFGDYMILSEGEYYDTPKLASFDKVLCKEVSNCKNPSEFFD